MNKPEWNQCECTQTTIYRFTHKKNIKVLKWLHVHLSIPAITTQRKLTSGPLKELQESIFVLGVSDIHSLHGRYRAMGQPWIC